MKKIIAKKIQVTYNCPVNQNLYTMPVLTKTIWSDYFEVDFEVNCPCGEKHEINVQED